MTRYKLSWLVMVVIGSIFLADALVYLTTGMTFFYDDAQHNFGTPRWVIGSILAFLAATRAADGTHIVEKPDEEIKKPNPWKEAIIEELTMSFICTAAHENDPKKALYDAIEWNVKVALDPTVSREAQALIDRGASEALGKKSTAL